MVIDGNRRWLNPYHEKALEGLEKDRELGMDKDLTKGLGLGKEEEGTKDQEQGRELSITKGFERGFGF